MTGVREVRIDGYRSLASVVMPLAHVTVVVGANGSGKTNLYRALELLSAAANGRFASALASEGGMPSVLWAGKRRPGPVRVRLGVDLDCVRYDLSCGLPPPNSGGTMFPLDPQIREEAIVYIGDRETQLMERKNLSAWITDTEGRRQAYPVALWDAESVLSQLSDPERFPDVALVKRSLCAWRFYHHFRTDAASPLRLPQTAVRTPVLSPDGRDLPCALQTVFENGDDRALDEAVGEAFGGARLSIESIGDALGISLHTGLSRPLDGREISDGMLRYLCLLAALMSPRPAPLIVLNEPETSLHPRMLAPLARLISRASEASQIWITTHDQQLADRVVDATGALLLELSVSDTGTVIQR